MGFVGSATPRRDLVRQTGRRGRPTRERRRRRAGSGASSLSRADPEALTAGIRIIAAGKQGQDGGSDSPDGPGGSGRMGYLEVLALPCRPDATGVVRTGRTDCRGMRSVMGDGRRGRGSGRARPRTDQDLQARRHPRLTQSWPLSESRGRCSAPSPLPLSSPDLVWLIAAYCCLLQ